MPMRAGAMIRSRIPAWTQPASTGRIRSLPPVAQLDRVLPSEGRGRTFESSRARHKINDLGHFRVAFFTPYGIHTEIRLSATPARGPRRGARIPGYRTRRHGLSPLGGVATTAPPLPCCQTSQGLSLCRPVAPAARYARRSLAGLRAAYARAVRPPAAPGGFPGE